MKFEIKKDRTTDKKITLDLKRIGNAIVLVGYDPNGQEKDLMEFEMGTFYRVIGAELEGLDTDKEGRIKEAEGEE